MNGAHDLGGVHGLGPVAPEESEPVFHSPWERRIFGITLATMGQGLYNLDEFRHGIEKMHPVHYLGSTYYEHWLYTLEKNLVARGVITEDELEAKRRHYLEDRDAPLPTREDPALVEGLGALVETGGSSAVAVEAKPAFGVGDRVRTRNTNPTGHTRLPRYTRDKEGVVERVYPSFVFPDTNAHRQGEDPQYVYNVRFAAEELWGDSAEPREDVYVDLWESYLVPA